MRKESLIHRIFEGLAPRYDLFNRLSSLGLVGTWYRRLFEEASFASDARILDLCTGTGEIALGFRRSLTNGAVVIGLDFSESMLARARRKESRERRKAYWVDARAAALPFRNDSFDGVTMAFAMRNMESVRETLTEICRALKQDGRVYILELGRPHHPVLRTLHRLWLLSFVKVVGFFLRGKREPFDYLSASIYEFLEPDLFLAELEACGFGHTRYVPLHNGIAGIYTGVKK